MRNMTMPAISPGWDANCFPAMSVSIKNMPVKAWIMGVNIWGKALKMTWKMSNEARMCDSVSMV